MKFGSCDDLCKLLHVCWLDVNNVEALVLDVEIPKVDAEIVTADEGLAIAVHRYAVDVVCVGICVDLAWHSGDNGIVMCHTRELQIRYRAEVLVGVSHRTAAICATRTSWCQL